jgi:hypothetical protein
MTSRRAPRRRAAVAVTKTGEAMSNHWMHGIHQAHRASHEGSHKTAGVIYIIVGLFMAPFLIGIPLMIYGIYKLAK